MATKKSQTKRNEELGNATSGPLSDIGDMERVGAPDTPDEPKVKTLKDPSDREPVFGRKVEQDAEHVVTTDETKPDVNNKQSVFVAPKGS